MTQIIEQEFWTPPEAFNGEVKPRRVLARSKDRVIYSDGGKRTKECTQEAFERWIKKYSCRRNAYDR